MVRKKKASLSVGARGSPAIVDGVYWVVGIGVWLVVEFQIALRGGVWWVVVDRKKVFKEAKQRRLL